MMAGGPGRFTPNMGYSLECVDGNAVLMSRHHPVRTDAVLPWVSVRAFYPAAGRVGDSASPSPAASSDLRSAGQSAAQRTSSVNALSLDAPSVASIIPSSESEARANAVTLSHRASLTLRVRLQPDMPLKT